MRSGLHCTWKPLKARPGRMTLWTPVSQCLRGYPMYGFPSTGNQFSSRPVQDDFCCVMTGTQAIYHAPAGMRTPCVLRRAPPLSACMCGRTVQLTVRHACSTAGSKMRVGTAAPRRLHHLPCASHSQRKPELTAAAPGENRGAGEPVSPMRKASAPGSVAHPVRAVRPGHLPGSTRGAAPLQSGRPSLRAAGHSPDAVSCRRRSRTVPYSADI